MGCAASSNSGGTVINSNPAASAPPYYGPKVEYRFVNTEVSMTGKMFALKQGDQLTSSDMDSFYPLLSAPMAEGFHMVCYRNVPGQVQTQMMSTTVKLPYQAIYMKKESEPENTYTLLIERSSIQPTQIRHGLIPLFGNTSTEVNTETNHLLSSIMTHSQNGGRFVTLCASGNSVSSGYMNQMSGKSPVSGVDLFFEIPNMSRGKFVYQTIPVPVQISMKIQGLGNPQTIVNCDWLGNFHGPLSQGWKMVNIFFDMSSSMNMQQGLMSMQAGINLNTIWFFEKPEDQMNDNTQKYEGTMVEFIYDVGRSGLFNIKSNLAWEGKITEMGQQGWELVCIIDYPGLVGGGGAFSKPTLKLLMFFQRELQH
ncbi:hypothetical protein LOTGIDRAFT_234529 [Lottia gigantea]|uniref:Uncharacterized protein n=1 Tax=Lottia gigantea TaxID=225164 RepID=V4A0N3_LOTGI|nr:hypothetical protein LOTGIDRAFT_234529 [Lottia gigantea]ESO88475.1 hypothetical protein LOTGIDRAFT_234529 [Lottia gigantea]